MSLRNAGANGFKFSFKAKDNASIQTPKFTSIELQSNEFAKLKSQHKHIKQRKKRNFKDEEATSIQFSSKKKLKKLDLSLSQRNLVFHADQKTQQPSNEIFQQNSKSRSITLSVSNKKLVLLNRPKRPEIVKNQSLQKLFKRPYKESIDKQHTKSDIKLKQSTSSYLQIYKRQKRQRQLSRSKQKLNNLILRRQVNITNPLEKMNESPKSVVSNRDNPKIFNKFFEKNHEPDFITTEMFPQTEKNKKFVEQQQYSTNFFRKNDLKKNVGPSKALFKTQNTNVNVRLNNLGGNISKLNIHID